MKNRSLNFLSRLLKMKAPLGFATRTTVDSWLKRKTMVEAIRKGSSHAVENSGVAIATTQISHRPLPLAAAIAMYII